MNLDLHQGNQEMIKEYSINLTEFFIKKYKVKRVYDRFASCLLQSSISFLAKHLDKNIDIEIPYKLKKYCESKEKLSIAYQNAKVNLKKFPNYYESFLLEDKFIEKISKYYDMHKNYQDNYLDRLYSIDECISLKKKQRTVVLEYEKISKDENRITDLKHYINQCYNSVLLENEYLTIEIFNPGNKDFNLTYKLKRSAYETFDLQYYEQIIKNKKNEIKIKSNINEETL